MGAAISSAGENKGVLSCLVLLTLSLGYNFNQEIKSDQHWASWDEQILEFVTGTLYIVVRTIPSLAYVC